jgi:hypothetical protein
MVNHSQLKGWLRFHLKPYTLSFSDFEVHINLFSSAPLAFSLEVLSSHLPFLASFTIKWEIHYNPWIPWWIQRRSGALFWTHPWNVWPVLQWLILTIYKIIVKSPEKSNTLKEFFIESYIPRWSMFRSLLLCFRSSSLTKFYN